jgi:hypothetical protein
MKEESFSYDILPQHSKSCGGTNRLPAIPAALRAAFGRSERCEVAPGKNILFPSLRQRGLHPVSKEVCKRWHHLGLSGTKRVSPFALVGERDKKTPSEGLCQAF